MPSKGSVKAGSVAGLARRPPTQPSIRTGGGAGGLRGQLGGAKIAGPSLSVHSGNAAAATGAFAGAPGAFTPSGAPTPANFAAMTGKTATPTTNWTVGQHVTLADGTFAHWNGTAWVAGKHP